MVKSKASRAPSKTASRAPSKTASRAPSRAPSKTASRAPSKTASRVSRKKRLSFSLDVDTQKQCHPGPNVEFNKKLSSIGQYLNYIDRKGFLGCRENQYPIYVDGKYCCSTEKSTDQERYDYIMKIFKSIVENVNDTELKKQVPLIKGLRKIFDKLLERSGPQLERDIDLEKEYLYTIDQRVLGRVFSFFGFKVVSDSSVI